jgi:hypothetical protein
MSIHHCAFLFLLIASLAACDRETTSAPSASAVEAATNRCPSRTFEGFFAAFADSVDLQKAFTRRPLRSDSIDARTEPEPKPITKMLSAEALEFPLVPSRQQVADEGLEISIKTSGSDTVVELTKPETDYMVSYYFERAGDCWRLHRKNDESL